MSNTNEWNALKPPPLGPTIPGSIKHSHAIIGTGAFVTSWPTQRYPGILTCSVTIDYSLNPFNYIKIDCGVLTITINQVPIGTMIIVEVVAGTINIVANSTINISSTLGPGTHVIVIFDNAIKHNDLTNPVSV